MRKLSFGFALLFLLQLGISAPENSSGTPKVVPPSKGLKSQQSFSPATPQQVLGDQIARFLGGQMKQGKTGKELMAEKAGDVALAGVTATQAFSGKASVPSKVAVPLAPVSKRPVAVKSVSTKSVSTKLVHVPPPPTARASVPQIRQEIQKILDLNKKIKNVQSGSSAQFQRVQEQARIHQKILNDLEATQKQSSSQKVPTKSALLAQEKLRIIHEETQRSAKVVEGLKKVPAKIVPKEALKAKTVVS